MIAHVKAHVDGLVGGKKERWVSGNHTLSTVQPQGLNRGLNPHGSTALIASFPLNQLLK